MFSFPTNTNTLVRCDAGQARIEISGREAHMKQTVLELNSGELKTPRWPISCITTFSFPLLSFGCGYWPRNETRAKAI